MMLIVIAPVRAEDTEHYKSVVKEMKTRGSPTVQAQVLPGVGFNIAVAIEGSHRIRAASELGLPINIQPILKSNRVAHLILNDIFAYRGQHGYIFNSYNIIENVINETPHPSGWSYEGK